MEIMYKAYRICVSQKDGEFKVAVKRFDGTLIEHEDNPDYYAEQEDAIAHGKFIIDEWINN